MKKYELTNETITVDEKVLYKVRALKDFDNVEKGDLGGYVESEKNLSHLGNCWVYDKAIVYDNARICNNAKVYGNAKIYDNATIYDNAIISNNAKVYDKAIICGDSEVYGNACIYGSVKIYGVLKVCSNADICKQTHLFQTCNIGSRNDATTFFKTKDNKIKVVCGCFFGNIEEFKNAVCEKHRGTKHKKTYELAIELAKTQIKLDD